MIESIILMYALFVSYIILRLIILKTIELIKTGEEDKAEEGLLVLFVVVDCILWGAFYYYS